MWQATNEVITRVPESTQDEMQTAAESCKRAFQDWSQTTILTRQQMMFRLQNLIRENLVMCMLCWVTIRMQNLPFHCSLFHSLTTSILDSLHKKLDGEQHNTEVLIFWMMMFYLSEKFADSLIWILSFRLILQRISPKSKGRPWLMQRGTSWEDFVSVP